MPDPFVPPFILNKDSTNGDKYLLECLKKKLSFSFLSEECKKRIKVLKLTNSDESQLRHLHKDLLELWPLILTDALQFLKSHDPREYDKKNAEMMSFFDPASLGTTELTEVLTGFSDFEGMMFGASPDRYRDHIAHSFRVWIIGHGILKSCFNGKFPIIPSYNFISISEEEWECMWAIIALCHDIGYPVSHIEKINEKARLTLKKQGLLNEGDMRYTFSQQMLPFHDTLIKLMSSDPVEIEKDNQYCTHLQNKYYLKLLKSFDRLEHGVVSSLLISRALVYFLESDFSHDSRKTLSKEDIRQFFIRREILRAIAAHTCQDIYHLTFDNIYLLLYLVDEIQCWGRPTLEESQHEAVDVDKGHAKINKFYSNNIDIRIITADKIWDTSQQKGVLYQILKLRKMLRLALGRADSLYNRLKFEVRNKGSQLLRLEMKKKA